MVTIGAATTIIGGGDIIAMMKIAAGRGGIIIASTAMAINGTLGVIAMTGTTGMIAAGDSVETPSLIGLGPASPRGERRIMPRRLTIMLAAVTVAAAAAAAFSTAEKGYVIVVQSAGIISIKTCIRFRSPSP